MGERRRGVIASGHTHNCHITLSDLHLHVEITNLFQIVEIEQNAQGRAKIGYPADRRVGGGPVRVFAPLSWRLEQYQNDIVWSGREAFLPWRLLDCFAECPGQPSNGASEVDSTTPTVCFTPAGSDERGEVETKHENPQDLTDIKDGATTKLGFWTWYQVLNVLSGRKRKQISYTDFYCCHHAQCPRVQWPSLLSSFLVHTLWPDLRSPRSRGGPVSVDLASALPWRCHTMAGKRKKASVYHLAAPQVSAPAASASKSTAPNPTTGPSNFKRVLREKTHINLLDGHVRQTRAMVEVDAGQEQPAPKVYPDIRRERAPLFDLYSGGDEDVVGEVEEARDSRESDDPLRQWAQDHLERYLDEALRLEGRGSHCDFSICPRCPTGADKGEDGGGREEVEGVPNIAATTVWVVTSSCANCLLLGHRQLPFHRIEHWTGARFERKSLKDLGLRIQL
ncbi:hypothetical protein C8R47DRAFT_1083465, partial [Mycena vitilis]